jgi:hypothetical protein
VIGRLVRRLAPPEPVNRSQWTRHSPPMLPTVYLQVATTRQGFGELLAEVDGLRDSINNQSEGAA